MAYSHENTAHIPRMTGRDIRNTMQAGVVQQATQDPMAQIMQQMQMQQQQQELEESPMQMAMRQLQMEAAQQAMQAQQQQMQQSAEMHPLDIDYRRMMADPRYRKMFEEQNAGAPQMMQDPAFQDQYVGQ